MRLFNFFTIKNTKTNNGLNLIHDKKTKDLLYAFNKKNGKVDGLFQVFYSVKDSGFNLNYKKINVGFVYQEYFFIDGYPNGYFKQYDSKGNLIYHIENIKSNSFNFRRSFNIHFITSKLLFSDKYQISGFVNEYYSNGLTSEEFMVLDNIIISSKSYYQNGQIRHDSIDSNGELNGYIKKFYENGQIKSHSIWKEGKQNGLTLSYNSDGLLIRKSNLINDEYDKVEEYYKNGNLRLTNFKENYTFFSENNQKKCEIVADANSNKPKGIWINYDENEIINYKLNFDFDNFDNQSNDKVLKTTYDKSGNLLTSSIVTFKVKSNYFHYNFSHDYFRERFDNKFVVQGGGIKGPPGAGARGFTSRIVNMYPISCIYDLLDIDDKTDEDSSKEKKPIEETFGKGEILNNLSEKPSEKTLSKEEIERELYMVINNINKPIGHKDTSFENLLGHELFQENYEEKDHFRHLVIGTSKFERGDYEGAIEDYNKSIELNPNNARTYLEIGNAKLKLNDYKGAILDYSKSIEIDSNNADAYHNRSIAKSKLADYQGVIDDCTKTIEIDNNYTRAYFNRGTAYANLQEFMEAIGDMNKVMELEPNNSNAYKNRGICMYEFEQYDNALKDLNKAMELDPDSNAYITIDKIKEELLNIEVESINKIINTVETNYEFKNKIEGFIKNEKIKNFELTISISKWYGHTPFKCSGEFEGHNFTSEIVEVAKWGICEHNYKDLNKLLTDIKDYEIEVLHKHLDIDIISEEEDFEIEFIKWEEGTPDEFIEEIEEEWGAFDIRDNSTEEEQLDFIYKEGAVIDGIRILLSNDDSTFELSWIYSKENEENDKVISALKHASEFNKDLLDEAINKISNAHIDNDKSYDYYENGQYQEGIESVKKALEVIPNRSNFLDTLAIGYYYLGDYNSAIEASNNCIDFDIEEDSENAEHYFNRGNIHLKMNENVKAKHDFEKALEIDNSFEPAIDAINNLIEEENEFDLIINQINTELSELSDKTKGELYDYSYWFEVVCNRAKSHSISIYGELNNENINKLSDGHCEEYHYRMIENNDIEKAEFITPRIISFALIYEKLLSINQSKLSSDDISKLEVLKFHSISSLYGSIKFALEDITEGKKLVNEIYPNYIEELTSKNNNNKTEYESDMSIRLFSPKIRYLLNGLIINKIQQTIPKKNTSEFVNLIKLVNQILPIDISNENNEDNEIYDLIKLEISSFNNEQTLLLQRLFSVLIIYSKKFLYVDLLIYIIELINVFGIEISDHLENDIEDTEIVFDIIERLKAKFNIFNFVDSIKFRLYSGVITNENDIFEIVVNEFSLEIFLNKDEEIIKATQGLEIQIKRAFEMILAAKMIKLDVDFLATILNEHENDRFYGFDYIENYHSIYLNIYSSLISISSDILDKN